MAASRGRLPTSVEAALEEIADIEQRISALEQELILEDDDGGKTDEVVEPEASESAAPITDWLPPRFCVPINADVRTFNFKELGKAQLELTGRKFDVIMMDPPWQLASSNPTRGVAIGYQQLGDNLIQDIPIAEVQDSGLMFMWVINAKYRFAINMLEKWGYKLIDELAWVKQTVNRRLAKSHGYYLQHAKETCLIALKGDLPPGTVIHAGSDVIFSQRRGQSQKPTEVYELIERLVPTGSYLEIFGRRNNLRDYWVTVGNEL